jgi:hypothetical protein
MEVAAIVGMPRVIGFLCLILTMCGMAVGGVKADALLAPEMSEEVAIRRELERIAPEHPEKAADVGKILDGLNQPPNSAQGLQLRGRHKRGARRIVNGIHTVRHSAVAAVLKGNDPNTASAWCTGTLVGCDKVLTAAHCISENPTPSGYLAFFPSLGFFRIKGISWLKDDYKFPYADLAMLTLDRSVEGIEPIALNTVASPINSSIATIVGYGRTGGAHYDYGIKREGSAKFGKCTSPFADKKLLCWDYDADINVAPQDANTCNADSGGGVFMFDKDVQRVVGVVSGGYSSSNCVKNDHSYNTDVFKWRDWLTAVGEGRLSNQTCAASKIDIPSNLRSALATLSSKTPEATFELDIPRSTKLLRVAMNAEDSGNRDNDFDLFVFNTESHSVCSQDGAGQFAFCEAPAPTAGRWTISLRRKKGAGEAQLTVTVVPE